MKKAQAQQKTLTSIEIDKSCFRIKNAAEMSFRCLGAFVRWSGVCLLGEMLAGANYRWEVCGRSASDRKDFFGCEWVRGGVSRTSNFGVEGQIATYFLDGLT